MTAQRALASQAKSDLAGYSQVLGDVVGLVHSARHATARLVNAAMTATYWRIGRRIVEWEQGGKARAPYADALLERLSADLTSRLGRGFSLRNLRNFRQLYLYWPIRQTASAELLDVHSTIRQTASAESQNIHVTNQILQMMPEESMRRGSEKASRKSGLGLKTTIGQPARASPIPPPFPLPWSHYVRLLTVKDPAVRSFYETEALRGGWTVKQLDRQINSLFYERTALSKNKAAMLTKGGKAKPEDALTPEEELKDPFVLEFLGLKDEYSEAQLEESLIHHLQAFLLELGDDYAFVGRQRRLRIGDQWFRVDLLFYHRTLRCLLIIDLKLGAFTHADAGQMHMYLNYAAEHWVRPGENPPVGLILCAQKDAAVARYALDNLPTKVLAAEYRVALPSEAVLAREVTKTRKLLERRAVGRSTVY